ncbi:hypothetical protein, partial [Klebsiella pneumoniae]|uniref:hypothetical protein n=1 Tax=Klebsiella pneumoniae TaxID=573 RepID=UPI003F568AB4
FITVSVGMVLANRCHRQNMKTSIINGSEVSRLSVAIQSEIFTLFQTRELVEQQYKFAIFQQYDPRHY